MKHKIMHMIGNAHIDPVWRWQWQEGFHEVKATFRSALDRMSENADFIFTASSAAFYEWVEQNDPAMFAEIKARVAEGRWCIVGGWWVEPDCNIPSGESFVRHGLYGQRYFQQKLGSSARVGYNVDSFGHHGMLPQILTKSGMDYYVFMRPDPHEKALASDLFWWESDDGSRVLAFRIPYEYVSPAGDIEMHVRRCAAEMKDPFETIMCFYGVGNHGGGPTTENLESIRRLDKEPDLPRLVFSSPDRFFADVVKRGLPIPVVHDDLQHHASGCYAVHSGIKRWNRQAENLLLVAEKFAAIAHWVTGQPYPTDLAQAWKNVLFNQFHDILAGSSVEAAYEDARALYGEATAIAGRALNHAIQSLAWNIRIPQEEGVTPIVVFNPHAWTTRSCVEVELRRVGDPIVLDDEGNRVPVQKAQPAATAVVERRLAFEADLPPLGYRVYRVVAHQTAPETPAVKADDCSLENARFRLQFDPATGYITSLRDKATQAEAFCGEAARPVVLYDPSDTWSHDVFRFDKVVGAFTATSIKLIAHGPVKSVMRVTSAYGSSTLVQDFTLYPDSDQIDVRVTVDWREQHKVLKLLFPVNLDSFKATYEIPYGHIERPANGEEEPGQSWIDVSGLVRGGGQRYGLSLLNDGKYSFSINGREMALTVLRSPIYSHHMPAQPDANQEYSYIDQGVQRFTYVLLPHEGSWETAHTVRRAAELNQQPIVLIGTYHPNGRLPQRDSYLAVDQENIIVSVVKKAEDSDDLVLRCYETTGVATRAFLRLPRWERVIETDFGPCEIKTLRVPMDSTLPVVETDLMERAIRHQRP